MQSDYEKEKLSQLKLFDCCMQNLSLSICLSILFPRNEGLLNFTCRKSPEALIMA